jgi:hypothetical protein
MVGKLLGPISFPRRIAGAWAPTLSDKAWAVMPMTSASPTGVSGTWGLTQDWRPEHYSEWIGYIWENEATRVAGKDVQWARLAWHDVGLAWPESVQADTSRQASWAMRGGLHSWPLAQAWPYGPFSVPCHAGP